MAVLRNYNYKDTLQRMDIGLFHGPNHELLVLLCS